MRERLAKSTPGPGTPLTVPSPTWGTPELCLGLGSLSLLPGHPQEPPGFGWLLTNASFSLFPSSFAFILTPTLGTVPSGLPAAPCWGRGRRGPSFCPQQEGPESRFTGDPNLRWTSSGISGPDFGPGVQLAGPQPTEPEQALSLGGLGAFLGAPDSFLSTQ